MFVNSRTTSYDFYFGIIETFIHQVHSCKSCIRNLLYNIIIS